MADFILAPQTITVSFGLEPVLNVVNTVSLLLQVDERSGFSEWVNQMSAKLSPERKRTLQLTVDGLYGALIPEENQWPSFPAYLEHLATLDPKAMRDESMTWMCENEKAKTANLPPFEIEPMLKDRAAYIEWMRQYYAAKHGDKDDEPFDESFFVDLHALYNDPHHMRDLLLRELRSLWDEHLAEDWERSLPMLRDSVNAFQQLEYSGTTPLEAIRAVTGRDLTDRWEPTLGNARHILFVPSAHIGPYLTWYAGRSGVARILFGARLPEGTRYESSALSRSELLVRLTALADDTRLQMLELLMKHNELCAQDIMTMLNLSQSSTSRHLRQLTATGYLVERRREVAKCYSLNPARFEDTVRALKRFVRGKPNS